MQRVSRKPSSPCARRVFCCLDGWRPRPGTTGGTRRRGPPHGAAWEAARSAGPGSARASALRQLTRRGCSSAAAAGRVASSAARPRAEHRSGVGASAPTAEVVATGGGPRRRCAEDGAPRRRPHGSPRRCAPRDDGRFMVRVQRRIPVPGSPRRRRRGVQRRVNPGGVCANEPTSVGLPVSRLVVVGELPRQPHGEDDDPQDEEDLIDLHDALQDGE